MAYCSALPPSFGNGHYFPCFEATKVCIRPEACDPPRRDDVKPRHQLLGRDDVKPETCDPPRIV